MIVLNRFIPEIWSLYLHIDNELGGYLATKHLLENGHKKSLCIHQASWVKLIVEIAFKGIEEMPC